MVLYPALELALKFVFNLTSLMEVAYSHVQMAINLTITTVVYNQ